MRWAQELRYPAMACCAHVLLAAIGARAGDLAGCEEHLADYRSHGGGPGTKGMDVLADGAPGAALQAARGPADALRVLERAFELVRQTGIGNPNMPTFVADLAEARLRDGDRQGAQEVAEWLGGKAVATGLAWPAAAEAPCRAMPATGPEEAARWLGHAEMAYARREMPYERARGLLTYGEVMRRLHRPGATREPLLAAHWAFAALGAGLWAEWARRELSAAGPSPGGRQGRPTPVGRIHPPQELQVARAVADGRTTRRWRSRSSCHPRP